MSENIKLIFITWTLGLCGGLVFSLLRLAGVIKILGYQKKNTIPPEAGLIVIYRHPSLREAAFLPFLFFPWFLFDFRLIPFSASGKINYYSKWWFRPFRSVCIPVDGENYRGLKQTLEQIKARLDKGGILVLAPGGGREFKGKTFKKLSAGIIETIRTTSGVNYSFLSKESNGKIIRGFQSGIGWILDNTRAVVLPVWVETNGIRTKITIGKPTRPPTGLFRKEIVEFLENSLLSLKT
jgi:hypothetical protein